MHRQLLEPSLLGRYITTQTCQSSISLLIECVTRRQLSLTAGLRDWSQVCPIGEGSCVFTEVVTSAVKAADCSKDVNLRKSQLVCPDHHNWCPALRYRKPREKTLDNKPDDVTTQVNKQQHDHTSTAQTGRNNPISLTSVLYKRTDSPGD